MRNITARTCLTLAGVAWRHFRAQIGSMDQIQYSIIEEPVGVYFVEIQDSNEVPYRVDGFRTKGEAAAWIQERQQRVSAAVRWEATQSGLVHKDE